MEHISFFLWGFSNFYQGQASIILHWIPFKVLVVQITIFLLSVEELPLLLCKEIGESQVGMWDVLGFCAQWESRPPGAC
jgi:hypothetical protein